MKDLLVFCEECRDDVGYVIKEMKMVGKIKGVEYHYDGREACCVRCGTLIDAPGVGDYNLKQLYDVYRKKNDIISLDMLQSIPDKYSIGKRSLSLLLGWGEQTFSRYYEGDTPSKQYSDILTKIYNDPAYYLELFEAGKSNMISPTSYEKSKNATEAALARQTDII